MKLPIGFYRVLLLLAGLFLFTACTTWLLEAITWIGPLLVTGLILLGVGVRAFPFLQSFSYTIFILASVTLAMFYPASFIQVGSFEMKILIIPLLQIIMFGMGSQMSPNDFLGVIRAPRAVLIGVMCQFTIMPLIALTLTTAFSFPVEIAAGIILVGSSPSGLASNVMSFLARANVALSVTLTAVATVLAPLLTPLLMKVFAGQMIPIDFWNMMLGIMDIVILPIIAGLTFNALAYGETDTKKSFVHATAFFVIIGAKNLVFFWTEDVLVQEVVWKGLSDVIWFLILPILGGVGLKRILKGDHHLIDQMMAFVSMLGIAVIITIITANGRESLLDIGLMLILVCFIHNAMGYTLGYWICRLLGMDERSCRTIALEVGMQNGGLASGIALQMGKVATVGLAPSVFGPMMNITGSSLATYWRGKPTKNEHNEN